eukprot:TRINITY_DN7016_c0_g1_i2.p1 TRINITY_DN7016_c0_g1~~TRINITY_DN7016_c0_g1_i2.p1  ORF type:complete len:178 (-),score=24.71 TRINITY_DN7016_c0_g1_i2:646-1179(-)
MNKHRYLIFGGVPTSIITENNLSARLLIACAFFLSPLKLITKVYNCLNTSKHSLPLAFRLLNTKFTRDMSCWIGSSLAILLVFENEKTKKVKSNTLSNQQLSTSNPNANELIAQPTPNNCNICCITRVFVRFELLWIVYVHSEKENDTYPQLRTKTGDRFSSSFFHSQPSRTPNITL